MRLPVNAGKMAVIRLYDAGDTCKGGGGWTEFPPSAFQPGLRHMVDDWVQRLVLSSLFIECRNKSPWRLRAGGTGHLPASNQDQMPPASTSNCP